MINRLQSGSLAVGLSCLLSLAAAVSAATGKAEVRRVGGSYHYIFDNITGVSDDAAVTLWMTLPGDRDGQKLKFSSFYPRPVEIVRDHEHGNRIAIWRLKPEPGLDHLVVGYDFTAVLGDPEPVIDPHAVDIYDTESETYRLYTRPEAWIETKGPVFVKAREIAGSQLDLYEQARLVFEWLVANLEFVPGGTWNKSAEGTLEILKGDCGQYSRLFTAMCRSLGIPARTVTSQYINGGLHRYAEFQLPAGNWLPVDIAVAQILVPGRSTLSEAEAEQFAAGKGLKGKDYTWLFGHIDRDQLVITVGNNIRVPIGEKGALRDFVIMEPGGVHAFPEAAAINGLNEDLVHGGFFHFGDRLEDAQIMDLAHQRLASLYLDAGMVDLVEEGCLVAQLDNTDEVVSWLNLGRVYLRKGDYARAEATIQRAMTLTVETQLQKQEALIWSHIYLGNCYDLMERRDMAIREYETVLELKNNYRGALDFAHKYLVRPFSRDDF